MNSPTAPSSPPKSLADQLDGRNLLAALEHLGDRMVAADLPHDLRKVVGGLVRLVETGSLEAPAAPLGRDEVLALNETEAENARLQAEVATLQAQMATVIANQAQTVPDGTEPPAAAPTPPADAGAVLPATGLGAAPTPPAAEAPTP